MKTKIFLTLLISLFCNLAMAEFFVVTAKDVINVDISETPSRACNGYQNRNLYTVTLTTTQKTYVKSFCESDYFIWGKLYTDVYKLMDGAPTPQCVLSEVCDRHTCRRVYGRTVIDHHDIMLKTTAKGELERHSVRLKTHCER